MKIRQRYECGADKIAIQYSIDEKGMITSLKEVNWDSSTEAGELLLPRIEVTDNCFNKIINNPKMV
ncbi:MULTISPECIES: hypothetical protein [Bacillus]|uniref:hypothetical protein n=1 Tax=Bacillus TaxID=1386 RepID=UPI0006AEECC4|nr:MULTISPECIES: hypothetical protein [Bacillus]AWD87971.1 hypothetical protein BVQ_11080 [Bacillus velezensis]KAF6690650.1 hypothetical protein G9362_16535 [Bacillus sp. EKM601B]KOS49206.1 hypothetical protein AN272_19920 [Bacillus amyloliquefaciens]MBA9149770.1 hypothetical protein [Bacillus sp. EKM213B]MCR4368069.1 hypothetical protein [Bacillus amyloliquefaciens]